jgi:galactokinase
LFDQITSLFGRVNHAVLFDCRTEEIRTVLFPPGLALIVAACGKERDLTDTEYNLRREQTHAAARALGVRALRDVSSAELARRGGLPEVLRRRAAHIIGEIERVQRALQFLENGDGVAFGKLLNASHESSRINFENSAAELDQLVSIARQLPGVLGARLTGAGFGGAILALCERSHAEMIAAELPKRYFEAKHINIGVFICRISGGVAYVRDLA